MPKYLDLFAGAGGLSEGFIRAGYEPIAHVEMDAAACYTLRTRTAYHWLKKGNNLAPYTKYLAGDITRKDFYALVPKEILDSVLNYEISEESLPAIFKDIDSLLGGEKLDLIVGGPPCQAYSIAGRSRSECKMVGDKRNYLYRLYAEFLKKYQPKYFVFENVLGLLSARDEDGSLHFDNMRALFKKCGYATDFRILNASDYGVLQNRKRIILIGFHGEKADFYPQIPVIKDAHKVGELFCDLPSIKAGEGVITPVKTTHYTGKYLFSARIKEYDGEPVTFHQARPNTAQDLEIYRIVVDTWNKSKTRVSYTDLPERLRTHNNTNSFLDRFKVVAGNLPYAQTVVAHIASATGSGVLKELLDQIYDAAQTVRSAHIQAGKVLSMHLKSRIVESLKECEDIDPFNIWEPIEMQVEGIGTVRILKIIDIGAPVTVDIADTNRLIDEE